MWLVKSKDRKKTYSVYELDDGDFLCSCRSCRFNMHDPDGERITEDNGRKKIFCKHILQVLNNETSTE